MSGSGISWAICKSAPRSRQITTPVPHHSVFYRLDALPAAQPTASKHWRHKHWRHIAQEGRWGETVSSYILWIILKTSIMSPRKSVYFRVGKFKWISLSLYGLYFSLIMSFMALFWIFLISLITPSLNGHETELANSTCGHTTALWSSIKYVHTYRWNFF